MSRKEYCTVWNDHSSFVRNITAATVSTHFFNIVGCRQGKRFCLFLVFDQNHAARRRGPQHGREEECPGGLGFAAAVAKEQEHGQIQDSRINGHEFHRGTGGDPNVVPESAWGRSVRTVGNRD